MAGAADDVTVIVNGAPFAGWKKVEVTQSFDKASGQGKLTISPLPGVPFPIHMGDEVTIICGSTPVLTGHVHGVDASHGWEDHDIHLTLHDKTKDLVDSTLGPGHESKPPITMKQLAQKTIGKMGLKIGVIDKVNPPPFGPAEVPVGQVGQTGFSFLDDWASKRQVLMNTDGKGNLVIDRNQKRKGSGALIKAFAEDPTSAMNNVKKATYKNSDEGRSNTTACAGQKSQNDLDHWESKEKGEQTAQADPMQTHWGKAVDTEVRPERIRHFVGGKGIDGDSPRKAARWRSNLARSRGFQYTATVQGFEMSPGKLWWPGYVIPVRDDHFEISDELLIATVKFCKDWDGGATTEVSCTYGDGFSESEAGSASKTAKRGVGSASVGAHPPASIDI